MPRYSVREVVSTLAALARDRGDSVSVPTAYEPSEVAIPTSLPAASRVRRIAAFSIDLGIAITLFGLGLAIPIGLKPLIRQGMFYKILVLGPCVYLLLRDAIAGRSIGKLLTGLVTWDISRRAPAGLMDSVIRNWPLAALAYPLDGPAWLPLLWPLYALKTIAGLLALSMVVQVVMGRPRRSLDGMATTQVVHS